MKELMRGLRLCTAGHVYRILLLLVLTFGFGCNWMEKVYG